MWKCAPKFAFAHPICFSLTMASHLSVAESQSACKSATTCSTGKYISALLTVTSDRECADCGVNTYSDEENLAMCKDCPEGETQPLKGQTSCQVEDDGLECPAGTYVDNSTCVDCPPNTFSVSINSGSCTAHRTCAAGTYVTVAASSTNNRECAACDAGTISTTENQPRCSSW